MWYETLVKNLRIRKPHQSILESTVTERTVLLALGNTFRTYEWLKPYQPIDLTITYLKQVLGLNQQGINPKYV